MRKLFMILGLAIIAGELQGCFYDNEEELYPEVKDTTTVITYSKAIQPLIGSNCAISGCHIPNNQAPDLSVYISLKANIDRVHVRAIEEKSMPAAGPLSSKQLQQLQQWIDGGALDN